MIQSTLTILSILFSLSLSVSYTGIFVASGSMYNSYTYTTTSSSNYVVATLTLLPTKSETVLIIRSTPLTPSTLASSWRHLDPRSTTQYDYEGLVVGRNQYAWIPNPGLGATIYIYVVNLEAYQRPVFVATVSQANFISRTCQTGASASGNFYCVSCVSGLVGAYCSISHTILAIGDRKFLDLAPGEYALVTLQAQSDASVSVQASASSISVYFQYQNRISELAGLVNNVGTYDFNHKDEYTVDLQNGRRAVGVGLINSNSYTTRVYIEYLQNDQSVVLIIVGVIGGLIFLAVLISIIILVYKNRGQERMVNPIVIPNMGVLLKKIANKLNQRDFNRYFPAVAKSDVLGKPTVMTSANKFQAEESVQQSDYECIICLCPLVSQDLIRAAYCKHIFHAHCLEQWFKKQQNCPYCRQDYSKPSTTKLYQQLCQEVGQKPQGSELVAAIFRPKINSTFETLLIEDMEDFIK